MRVFFRMKSGGLITLGMMMLLLLSDAAVVSNQEEKGLQSPSEAVRPHGLLRGGSPEAFLSSLDVLNSKEEDVDDAPQEPVIISNVVHREALGFTFAGDRNNLHQWDGNHLRMILTPWSQAITLDSVKKFNNGWLEFKVIIGHEIHSTTPVDVTYVQLSSSSPFPLIMSTHHIYS